MPEHVPKPTEGVKQTERLAGNDMRSNAGDGYGHTTQQLDMISGAVVYIVLENPGDEHKHILVCAVEVMKLKPQAFDTRRPFFHHARFYQIMNDIDLVQQGSRFCREYYVQRFFHRTPACRIDAPNGHLSSSIRSTSRNSLPSR